MRIHGQSAFISRVNRSMVAVATLALSAIAPTAHAITSEWIKGSNGLWDEWDSWSEYPQSSDSPSSTDSILIPKGTVTQGAWFRSARYPENIRIGAEGGLVITDLMMLSGDLVSAGQLTVDKAANRFALLRVAGNISLLAGGMTTLNASSESSADVTSAGFTVEEGHNLRVSNFDLRAATLVNQGVIEASGQLILDSRYGSQMSVVNQGVMRVVNGGRISGGQYGTPGDRFVDNTGGLIDIVNGSVALGTISGGVVRGGGASSMLGSRLENTTLEGEFNPYGLSFSGVVKNNAVLNLADGFTYTGVVGSVVAGRGEMNVADGRVVRLSGLNLGSEQIFRGSAKVVSGGLVNQGEFIVQGTHGLVVDNYVETAKIVNQGDMRISDGSRLVLSAKTFDNTGGTLNFQGRSEAVGWKGQNQTGWIVGGTVNGSGTQRVVDQLTFQDLVLNGRWDSVGNNIIGLRGRVVVNGSLVVGDAQAGVGGDLNIAGSVVLDGAGETILIRGSDYYSSEISPHNFSGYFGESRLTVGASHTLRGEGLVGTALRNEGLVQADVGRGLQFNNVVTNRGTLRAQGADMRSVSTGIDNQGGVIEVFSGASVHVTNGVVQGGVIRGVGEGGRLRVQELRDVTLQGDLGASDYTLWEGGSVGVSGTVVNQGVFRVGGMSQDGRSYGGMVVRGAAVLSGEGVTQMGAGGVSPVIEGQCCGAQLLLEAGHSLRGAGLIQWVGITNRGAVIAQGGTLDVRGGQDFLNQGLLQIEDGAVLRSDGSLIQEGASAQTLLDGQLEAQVLAIRGGVLEGRGLLNADLEVGDAKVKVGASSGQLEILGDYSATEDSILEVMLDDDLPALVVYGRVLLGGALLVDVGSFADLGASFDVLLGSEGISGEFSRVQLTGTDFSPSVAYLGDRVTISLVSSVPEPLSVWLMSLGLLAIGWGTRGKRGIPASGASCSH